MSTSRNHDLMWWTHTLHANPVWDKRSSLLGEYYVVYLLLCSRYILVHRTNIWPRKVKCIWPLTNTIVGTLMHSVFAIFWQAIAVPCRQLESLLWSRGTCKGNLLSQNCTARQHRVPQRFTVSAETSTITTGALYTYSYIVRVSGLWRTIYLAPGDRKM